MQPSLRVLKGHAVTWKLQKRELLNRSPIVAVHEVADFLKVGGCEGK